MYYTIINKEQTSWLIQQKKLEWRMKMYKVTVTKDGKEIRVRHFTTKAKAEKYEDEQYARNIIASMCDFKIEKVEK